MRRRRAPIREVLLFPFTVKGSNKFWYGNYCYRFGKKFLVGTPKSNWVIIGGHLKFKLEEGNSGTKRGNGRFFPLRAIGQNWFKPIYGTCAKKLGTEVWEGGYHFPKVSNSEKFGPLQGHGRNKLGYSRHWDLLGLPSLGTGTKIGEKRLGLERKTVLGPILEGL